MCIRDRLTYDEYLNEIKVNRDKYQLFYKQCNLEDSEIELLGKITNQAKGPKKLLVIGEDWCPDVFRGMPEFARIAEAADIEMRIFPRDENLDIIGAFCRINYVPSADKFLVTFGGTSKEKRTQGYGYKWYTTDMEFTGEVGLFEDRCTDTASVMVDSTYYFLTDGGKDIWALKKYDPITWTLLEEVSMSRDPNKEPGNDFMLAYVNEMLNASGLYIADAESAINQKDTDPYKGEATSHRFFTEELEFLESRVLSDTPHINASSMVFVDGIYNLVTSTAFFGDLICLLYTSPSPRDRG